ncbi:MAG TPA: ion transporter [Turneriella sp.]|nr:ion transporter [Turneriella sp.]
MRRWRKKLHEIIYEADTTAGKIFDITLIIIILASVLVIMLDSVQTLQASFHSAFSVLEWFFTVVFTIEYVLRLWSVERPLKYALSFYGVVDILSIIPTWAGLFFPQAHYLLSVRVLRVLRIFRVLKLANYLTQVEVLKQALVESRRKITVFLITVFTIAIIVGSLIYIIEGGENGFSSIPRGIYWAIVTLTTVGYGDIAPKTNFGQALATIVMVMGYAIIAVPTGIVTAELTQLRIKKVSTQACSSCASEGHDSNAKFCKFCGAKL